MKVIGRTETKNLINYINTAIKEELEIFINNAEYTTFFNHNMRRLIDEINEVPNDEISIEVLFNTKGEISVIDAEVLAKYISSNYIKLLEVQYDDNLTNIFFNIKKGEENDKETFVRFSFDVLCGIFNHIYKNITVNKGLNFKYIKKYQIKNYREEDIPLKILVHLILEDICKKIGEEHLEIISYLKNSSI